MLKYALCIAIGMAAATGAVAQSQEQKNVMQHLAVLFVANKWCSDYRVSVTAISAAAAKAKVNVDKEPFRTFLNAEVDKSEEALSDAGAKAGCDVIYGLYGPKGSAVSGQIMRK